MRTAPATAAAPFHSCWPRMPHVAVAATAAAGDACEWERQPPGNDATAETGSGSRVGSFNLQWRSGRTIVSPAISSSNAQHTHTHMDTRTAAASQGLCAAAAAASASINQGLWRT